MFVPIVEGVADPHSTILAWFRTCDLSLTELKDGLELLWIQLTKRLTPLYNCFHFASIFVYLLL